MAVERRRPIADKAQPRLVHQRRWLQRLACAAFANPRAVLPDAVVELRTPAGAARVQAQWRYSDTSISAIDHRAVGPDLKASGPKNRTFDFTPDARAATFDDSKWEIIPADSLEQRRGNGRLALSWYRLNVTIPEKVGRFETRGSTVAFEIVVDDYAEVWVNGQLPFVLGQNGGGVAAGWNAPNRVVLTRDARPGEKFQIAVLGINGPLSTHPDTYIWVRSATLDFYAPTKIRRLLDVKLAVERKHDDLDQIVPPWTKLFKVADGFTFTEGPLWVNEGDGYLLFSDPNNNGCSRRTSF
jgi:gluconolactonase